MNAVQVSDEDRPLAGKRVVVTRAAERADSLCARLQAMGAEPILLPTIQFVSLPAEPLLAAIQRRAQYDWLLFTSATAVDFFFRHADQPESLSSLPRLAAVGPATAAKLREHGLTPEIVPDKHVSEALIAALGNLNGQRVLLPHSRKGRPQLAALLQSQGATVDEIPIYDTVTAEPDPATLDNIRQGIDIITFTSPSTVHGFLTILDKAGIDRSLMDGAVVACIGPITAQAAEEAGLSVTVTAAAYTAEGLIQSLIDYCHSIELREI